MLVFHRLYSFTCVLLVFFSSIERLNEENKSLKLKVSADTDLQEKVCMQSAIQGLHVSRETRETC